MASVAPRRSSGGSWSAGRRGRVVLATKVGLEWRDGGDVVRNATRERIMKEIAASLRRLRTDHIDIQQVYWLDPLVPVDETAEALYALYREAALRAVRVACASRGVASVGRSGYRDDRHRC
jgi:aryl-alcohol dehydrogenase-like predicted oxidoreductase